MLLSTFSCNSWLPVFVLGKMSLQVLCLLFNQVFWSFFAIELYEFPIYFECYPHQIHGLEIISPILWLAFSFYCFFFSLFGGPGPQGQVEVPGPGTESK